MWEDLDEVKQKFYDEIAAEWNISGPDDKYKPMYVVLAPDYSYQAQ